MRIQAAFNRIFSGTVLLPEKDFQALGQLGYKKPGFPRCLSDIGCQLDIFFRQDLAYRIQISDLDPDIAMNRFQTFDKFNLSNTAASVTVDQVAEFRGALRWKRPPGRLRAPL